MGEAVEMIDRRCRDEGGRSGCFQIWDEVRDLRV